MIKNVAVLFSKTQADEGKMPVAQIEALVQSFYERKRTGLLRIAYDDGRQLHLFFKRGHCIHASLVSRYSREELKNEQWRMRIQSSGEAMARIIPVSIKSLLLAKILIQEEDLRSRVEQMPAGDVYAFLEGLQTQKKAILAHIDYNGFDGAALIPGSLGTTHSVLLNAQDLRDEASLEPYASLQGGSAKLTLFEFNSTVPAWQEYMLRRSFSSICERTLSRFEVMAGRSLSDSLVRLLIVFASRQNLDINVSASRRIVDREIFQSPQDAAREYQKLLNEMFTHFSGVMGGRLLSNTLRELTNNLPVAEKDTIARFNLLPEGYFYGF